MMNLNARPVFVPMIAPAPMPLAVAPQAPATPCGCHDAEPAPTGLAAVELPRSLAAFAPTSSWTSNLFPDTNGGGAKTGQVTPATVGTDTWSVLASGLGLAGTALGAYHGYRRTGSVGWAVGWALLGGLFPIITIPVAFAQGFARPEPAFRGVRKNG